MTIQSVVALRLTPSLANKPGVPLEDSLHPMLLTDVAFATLEFGSRHKEGTRTNSHRLDTPERLSVLELRLRLDPTHRESVIRITSK